MKRKVLNKREIELVSENLEVLDIQARCYLILSLFYGLRQKEIVSLEKDAFKSNDLYFSLLVPGRRVVDGDQFHMLLNPVVLQVNNDHACELIKLFTSKPVNSFGNKAMLNYRVKKEVSDFLCRLGIEDVGSLYSLRKTWAFQMVEELNRKMENFYVD